MFEHKCYCKFCGLEAVYLSRKQFLTEKEKKDLDFTCNDCFHIFELAREANQPEQLGLFA